MSGGLKHCAIGTCLLGFVSHAIRDALLEALEVLVEISLFFE
jgi:hypothetical protein